MSGGGRVRRDVGRATFEAWRRAKTTRSFPFGRRVCSFVVPIDATQARFLRPRAILTTDHRRFLHGYIAGRIPTARLLDEAWKACQEQERSNLAEAVLSGMQFAEESHDDLEPLSDEEVDQLYRATMRKVATDWRRAPGVIQ